MTHSGSPWLAVLALLTACHGAAREASPSPLVPLPPVALSAHDTIAVGVLRGQVVARLSGYSVVETLVSLDGGATEARTDSTGRFEVRGLLAGPHRIEVRRLPLRPTLGTVEMPARGGAVLRVVLEPVTVCLDYCAPERARAYGALEDVP